jgi:hypothetical protein
MRSLSSLILLPGAVFIVGAVLVVVGALLTDPTPGAASKALVGIGLLIALAGAIAGIAVNVWALHRQRMERRNNAAR